VPGDGRRVRSPGTFQPFVSLGNPYPLLEKAQSMHLRESVVRQTKSFLWVPALLFFVLFGLLGISLTIPMPPSLVKSGGGRIPQGLGQDPPAPSGEETWVPLSAVSPWLIRATLAAEDKNFWKHHGVDFLATFRALRDALRYGKPVSGASTITQQLVKLAEDPPRPRTLATKVREMVLATRLEWTWSKEKILEEYLNRLNYGNNQYGCGAASRFYFGKKPMELSPAQAALLAGIPQAPARLNPYTNLG
jgi:hypothetical protein